MGKETREEWEKLKSTMVEYWFHHIIALAALAAVGYFFGAMYRAFH